MAVRATLAWEEEGSDLRAQRGPVAGVDAQFSLAPSIGVSGFVPMWARSIFSSLCIVVRACCLVPVESGGAASVGGAMRARAVCAACRGAACSRAVLPCGCGCCCGGVCVATLTTSGARVVVGRANFVYFLIIKT